MKNTDHVSPSQDITASDCVSIRSAAGMRRNRIVLACFLILAVMSWFCAMTPLVGDDSQFVKGAPGISGMWAAQVQEHLEWSGKFIGHFMSRVLLRGPAWLHPVLTPLMFLALIVSGVLLALGADWREKLRAWHLTVLAGLVWFALPAFGTVFFWRTGTPDYGYSLTWATLFLVPWRFWADRADFRMPYGILYFFIGVLGGWSNENLGMLAILAALGVTALRWRNSGLPLWAASGLAGAVAGWGMMMSAPGNAVRMASIGGIEKIPLLSLAAFKKFLLFWSTQQLEMLPYFLTALIIAWMLHRKGTLRREAWLPGFVFFLMAQASLAAFAASPSTPYRAMTATYFFAALCPFSLLAAASPQSIRAKAAFIIFCCLLASNVMLEARVFTSARPALAERDRDMADGRLNAASFAFPETDKFFFLDYDIREINFLRSGWPVLVPWDRAATLKIFEAAPVRAYVACCSVMLENLPQGKIHVAAVVHNATMTSLMQAAMRVLAGHQRPGVIPAATADLQFACASGDIDADGRAVAFIPGLKSVNDLAYIAVEKPGAPLVWRAVTVQKPQGGRP